MERVRMRENARPAGAAGAWVWMRGMLRGAPEPEHTPAMTALVCALHTTHVGHAASRLVDVIQCLDALPTAARSEGLLEVLSVVLQHAVALTAAYSNGHMLDVMHGVSTCAMAEDTRQSLLEIVELVEISEFCRRLWTMALTPDG
jgi:hypothetical protein